MGNLGTTGFEQWMKANLSTEQVANGTLLLLHKECPVTGQAIPMAGGRMTRILFASPRGYFNSLLTPEGARDNWSKIEGESDREGRLVVMIEIWHLEGELELIRELFPII